MTVPRAATRLSAVRIIRVEARDLLFALENRVPGTNHYLDTKTGEVIPVFSYNQSRILEQVKDDPDRYLRLAPQSGRSGFHTMKSFAATVSRPEFRQRLEQALAGSSTFRSFKAVLRSDPVEQRRWQHFRTEMMVRSLRSKLKEIGVELQLDRSKD